jgi:hypothetical protein
MGEGIFQSAWDETPQGSVPDPPAARVEPAVAAAR